MECSLQLSISHEISLKIGNEFAVVYDWNSDGYWYPDQYISLKSELDTTLVHSNETSDVVLSDLV